MISPRIGSDSSSNCIGIGDQNATHSIDHSTLDKMMDLSTAYRYNQNMMEYYTCNFWSRWDTFVMHFVVHDFVSTITAYIQHTNTDRIETMTIVLTGTLSCVLRWWCGWPRFFVKYITHEIVLLSFICNTFYFLRNMDFLTRVQFHQRHFSHLENVLYSKLCTKM